MYSIAAPLLGDTVPGQHSHGQSYCQTRSPTPNPMHSHFHRQRRTPCASPLLVEKLDAPALAVAHADHGGFCDSDVRERTDVVSGIFLGVCSFLPASLRPRSRSAPTWLFGALDLRRSLGALRSRAVLQPWLTFEQADCEAALPVAAAAAGAAAGGFDCAAAVATRPRAKSSRTSAVEGDAATSQCARPLQLPLSPRNRAVRGQTAVLLVLLVLLAGGLILSAADVMPRWALEADNGQELLSRSLSTAADGAVGVAGTSRHVQVRQPPRTAPELDANLRPGYAAISEGRQLRRYWLHHFLQQPAQPTSPSPSMESTLNGMADRADESDALQTLGRTSGISAKSGPSLNGGPVRSQWAASLATVTAEASGSGGGEQTAQPALGGLQQQSSGECSAGGHVATVPSQAERLSVSAIDFAISPACGTNPLERSVPLAASIRHPLQPAPLLHSDRVLVAAPSLSEQRQRVSEQAADAASWADGIHDERYAWLTRLPVTITSSALFFYIPSVAQHGVGGDLRALLPAQCRPAAAAATGAGDVHSGGSLLHPSVVLLHYIVTHYAVLPSYVAFSAQYSQHDESSGDDRLQLLARLKWLALDDEHSAYMPLHFHRYGCSNTTRQRGVDLDAAAFHTLWQAFNRTAAPPSRVCYHHGGSFVTRRDRIRQHDRDTYIRLLLAVCSLDELRAEAMNALWHVLFAQWADVAEAEAHLAADSLLAVSTSRSSLSWSSSGAGRTATGADADVDVDEGGVVAAAVTRLAVGRRFCMSDCVLPWYEWPFYGAEHMPPLQWLLTTSAMRDEARLAEDGQLDQLGTTLSDSARLLLEAEEAQDGDEHDETVLPAQLRDESPIWEVSPLSVRYHPTGAPAPLNRTVTAALVVAAYHESISFLQHVDSSLPRVVYRMRSRPVAELDMSSTQPSDEKRTRMEWWDEQLTQAGNDSSPALLLPSQGHCNEASSFLLFILQWYDRLPEYVLLIHAHRKSWHNNDIELVLNHLNWTHILAQPQHAVPPRTVRADSSKRDATRDKTPFYYSLNSQHQYMMEPEGWQIMAAEYESVFGRQLSGFESQPPFPYAYHCCAQFMVERAAILSRPREYWHRLYSWCRYTTLKPFYAGRILEWLWPLLFQQHAPASIPDIHQTCGQISDKEDCRSTRR